MTETGRDAIFISHTSLEDNAFTVWLGARRRHLPAPGLPGSKRSVPARPVGAIHLETP